MRKVLAIARVALLRFLRDRSTVFFVFVLPIGIVMLIGAQFGGDFSPRLGVTASDEPVAADITARLKAEDSITVVEFDTEDELLLAVERGNLSAGVSIPDDLDSALAAGDIGQVGFISRPDGVGPQLQVVVNEAIAGAVEQEMAVRFATSKGADPIAAATAAAAVTPTIPNLTVETIVQGESLFPASLGQFDIGASSQLVLFMFLTGLTGSAALIQSRHLGMTTRMAGTPTSVRTILTGEALGRFVIVFVQGVYIMAATTLLFGVGWGDPLGAAGALVLFAAVGAGAAMLFGAVFRNDQQAGGVAIVAAIGLAAVGGSMLPIELFSDTLTRIARFTPHYWANDAFAELVRHDASLVDILPQLGALAGFAAVLMAIASWRMRQVITRA